MQLDPPTLARINSLTKYPSIPTYHEIRPDTGKLTDTVLDFGGKDLFVTEKIDGTNARIIVFPEGDYIIGSREDLLYAMGDRVVTTAAATIVSAVQELAERLVDRPHLVSPQSYGVTVLYGEVYGRPVSSVGKQYSQNTTGFLLFDMMTLPPEETRRLLALQPAQISSWRQHDGQPFVAQSWLQVMAETFTVGLAPRITELSSTALPVDHQGMLDWLTKTIPHTRARIDDTGLGRSEGVVIRTPDRSQIAKIRYEDYERTLRSGR